MKIPALLLLVISLANTVIAMDNDRRPLGLMGIVNTNATGQLQCIVTYDDTTNSYSGFHVNKNFYPAANWYYQELSSGIAQHYYEQIIIARSKYHEKTE